MPKSANVKRRFNNAEKLSFKKSIYDLYIYVLKLQFVIFLGYMSD
jgi:hypothetical protein